MHLAQTALFGAIGVMALLLVLRPMVARLTMIGTAALPGGNGVVAALAGPAMAALQCAAQGQPHRSLRRRCSSSCSRTRAW